MENHINRISEHYIHAREKHPYFADLFMLESDGLVAKYGLEKCRCQLEFAIKNKGVTTIDVLRCEIAEIYEAASRDDKTQAIKECYDSIAVLLRMVDVLEGRQEFGK